MSISKGDVVCRHERVLPQALDPVAAACALRDERRIMVTSSAEADVVPMLYLGELAFCGSGLTAAVDFLASLTFAEAESLGEQSWVGFLGYDAARDVERLPARPDGPLPRYEFFLPETLIRFEADRTVVIGRGRTPEDAERAAADAVRALGSLGSEAPRLRPSGAFGAAEVSLEYDDYIAAVRRAKQYIVDGDVFQVVLSLAISVPAEIDGLAAYRELAAGNPSPYQFWYRGPRFEAVGCSPEPCVVMAEGRGLIRPLAGTRPRGADSDADARNEAELRASEKEKAEHRMLVDLARNDLGRVCRPGTVTVPRLMAVERFSRVMHLTSDVVGETAAGLRPDDLIRATFPAGTMTGAPKVRAMEIIDELEPTVRGLYSGAVGSFGAEHVDLFLTIRSLVLQGGRAHLQAGGGIVADSDPAEEHRECLAKLSAVARAIGFDLEGAVR
ncbi:anthranilate synthase component 1 [Catenulispora sp. GAS73]|uniref:anthranilate synthase component I family protein n=1 Tax=Catenulispora sp. GAS73 TaxID=3156269 RepID=UPI003516CDAB